MHKTEAAVIVARSSPGFIAAAYHRGLLLTTL
jgi:hypothetical protein